MFMSSQTQIRILPPNVANKIAAGEVVERPASVLKELIENSLDAGAFRIDAEIAAGGCKLIAVTDNGPGMDKDNAILSIERHATSKIKDVDDIEKIATLGFRGEALAAIASVSRFRLATCAAGENIGTEILAAGGKVQEVRETGCPAGTCVEVRDLFFNVPARRKFLRSYQTELSHIRTGFILQALSHHGVGMNLKVDGREAYTLSKDSSLEDRLRDLFGAEYLKNLIKVNFVTEKIKVYGYTSLPAANRPDRSEQYIYVNSRVTSSPLINYAIGEGYHTLLARDRHPSVFIFLEMNPALVDVNVHPTKKEVRFRHPGEVRDDVIKAIRNALGTGDAIAIIEKKQASSDTEKRSLQPAVQQPLTIENLPSAQVFKYPRIVPPEQPAPASVAPCASTATPAPNSSFIPHPSSFIISPVSPWSFCRVVGQIGGLYVVLETEDGYALMDPHAAHERVLYERFMKDMETGHVTIQNLLIPETVEMMPKDALCVRKNMDLFKQMGFGISEFGGDAFVVDALPSCFAAVSAKTLLTEIASSLEQTGARKSAGRWREEAIVQAACKSAVKARDKLTLQELEQLVVDLTGTELPYTCPHGRPTMIFTSFQDLNKKFGRE